MAPAHSSIHFLLLTLVSSSEAKQSILLGNPEASPDHRKYYIYSMFWVCPEASSKLDTPQENLWREGFKRNPNQLPCTTSAVSLHCDEATFLTLTHTLMLKVIPANLQRTHILASCSHDVKLFVITQS